jgi:hypothetical protein
MACRHAARARSEFKFFFELELLLDSAQYFHWIYSTMDTELVYGDGCPDLFLL